MDSQLAKQSSLAAVSEILNGCMWGSSPSWTSPETCRRHVNWPLCVNRCCVLVGQMKTAILEIRGRPTNRSRLLWHWGWFRVLHILREISSGSHHHRIFVSKPALLYQSEFTAHIATWRWKWISIPSNPRVSDSWNRARNRWGSKIRRYCYRNRCGEFYRVWRHEHYCKVASSVFWHLTHCACFLGTCLMHMNESWHIKIV